MWRCINLQFVLPLHEIIVIIIVRNIVKNVIPYNYNVLSRSYYYLQKAS